MQTKHASIVLTFTVIAETRFHIKEMPVDMNEQ